VTYVPDEWPSRVPRRRDLDKTRLTGLLRVMDRAGIPPGAVFLFWGLSNARFEDAFEIPAANNYHSVLTPFGRFGKVSAAVHRSFPFLHTYVRDGTQ